MWASTQVSSICWSDKRVSNLNATQELWGKESLESVILKIPTPLREDVFLERERETGGQTEREKERGR